MRSDLAALVHGPIVRVDFTARAVTTLCGGDASQAAAGWQRAFTASAEGPDCRESFPPWQITCTVGGPEIVVVIVERQEDPRITLVLQGRYGHTTFSRSLLDRGRRQEASAWCP